MATAHIFPSINCTTRRYTPGVFPTQEFESQNGSVTTLQYGNQLVNSKLEILLPTSPMKSQIFDNYKKANGGRDADTGECDWVELPLFGGPLDGIAYDKLRRQMREQYTGPDLRYRYAGPPTITSTFPGRSTVQVVLRGYLEGANSF